MSSFLRTGAFVLGLAGASVLPRAARADDPAPGAVVETATSPDLDAADLDRMGAILAYHAEDRRVFRTVLGWSVVGATLALDGASFFWGRDHADARLFLVFGSNAAMPLGFALLPNGRLDDIRAYYEQDRASGRPASWVIDEVTATWRREAHEESRLRNFAGWLEIAGGVLAFGFDAFLLVGETTPAANDLLPLEAGLAVVGATTIGYGVHLLGTDGPVASSLHEYERATGRHAETDARLDLLPRVALTPRGAVLGFGGRF